MRDDPRKLARSVRQALRNVTRDLEVLEDQGPAAFRLASDWASTSTGSGGERGPRAVGHISDPTGNGSTKGARAWLQMLDDLETIGTVSRTLAVTSARLAQSVRYHQPADRVDRETANELDALNRGVGECECCRTVTPSGRGDDRLRTVCVADGVRVQVCPACRAAWMRRGPGSDWDVFAAGRRGRA